jgi:hypothetical protein
MPIPNIQKKIVKNQNQNDKISSNSNSSGGKKNNENDDEVLTNGLKKNGQVSVNGLDITSSDVLISMIDNAVQKNGCLLVKA